MLTSVIYQNESRTVTLLDLPTSIENGQHLCRNRQSPRLVSTQPPDQPYSSIEPKGQNRLALLQKIPAAEQDYHQEIQAVISQSLKQIRSILGDRPWCLPRPFTTSPLRENVTQQRSISVVDKFESKAPVILSSIPNIFLSFHEIEDHVFSNPSSLCVDLTIGSRVHRIPPHSTFLLSDVRISCDALRFVPRSVLPATVDFILMDPPWQNRSARRARAYVLSGQDPFLNVLPIVQSHLKDDGFVGIWVTNKASIRQLVLQSLHQLNFQLYEEWLWLKSTVHGEPLTPLDGLWRRPYELLLLFAKQPKPRTGSSDLFEPANIVDNSKKPSRRVFVAVPDFHSRKPCLKEYIGSSLLKSNQYQAMEIFARKVTSGWFALGDQVLKFNEESHWMRDYG